MRSAVVAVVFVAACGGDPDGTRPMDARVGDTQTVVDMQMIDAKVFMDAPMADAPKDAIVITDAPADASGVTCNPLTQTGCNSGEKCTWLLDALSPTYVGHIGCAPTGTAMAGQACMFGAPGVTGYDNCQTGLVCSDYRGGTGVCKTVCDNQGGNPQCDAAHACKVYSGLFYTGGVAAAGVCDTRCDPLAENDFDGSGALTKAATLCGSAANAGCYGYPSSGFPPTAWTCTTDIHAGVGQPAGLRHRTQCLDTNGCADPGPVYYVNSCNQGYLPLLREGTNISTVICVALCKPHNCYMGSCGANNDFRLGDAPHRCNTSDAMGTFDTSAAAEHCAFSWWLEVDSNGTLSRSPTSDTVGFCFDHSKYLYDSDNNGTADTPYPACATLPNGMGSGTSLGAGDLGCVDSTNAGVMFLGKPRTFPDVRPLFHPTSAP